MLFRSVVSMRVAVTGHSRGIGLEIFNYFQNLGHTCIGFSRTNGYDISLSSDRDRIVEEAGSCDIFVNNACVYTDDSQLELLRSMCNKWAGLTDKIIINIGSRSADYAVGGIPFHNMEYAQIKARQDMYINNMSNKEWPWVINLKPSRVDTAFSYGQDVPKITTESVGSVVDYILRSQDQFRVRSITFVL